MLYVENVVIKTLASTFVEEMFENTIRKYLGRNETGTCLFECFLEHCEYCREVSKLF